MSYGRAIPSIMLLILLTLIPLSTAQETDPSWLPDGKLSYTVEWRPLSEGAWNLTGRTSYEISLDLEEETIINFKITYIFEQDAQNIVIFLVNGFSKGALRNESRGLLTQFEFVEPPKMDDVEMEPFGPEPFGAIGYYTGALNVSAGQEVVFTGAVKLVDDETSDLYADGLSFVESYKEAYLPLGDIIIHEGAFLSPSLIFWGSLGIPLPKNTIDVLKKIRENEDRILSLQSELQDAEERIGNLTQELENLREEVEPLQKQVEELQSERDDLQKQLSLKDATINRLQQDVSQLQTLFYVSIALFVLLMGVTAFIIIRGARSYAAQRRARPRSVEPSL